MYTVKIYQVNDVLREYQWLQRMNLSLLKIRNYEDTKVLMKYILGKCQEKSNVTFISEENIINNSKNLNIL